MRSERNTETVLKDHAINAFQASLLAIPVVGSSLEKLLFGTLNEKRSRRVERTLEEIAKKVEELGAEPRIDENEDLANLLESLLPQTAKATSETRRERLRDLIFNAITLPSGDPRWSEAKMAAELVEGIDDLGLLVISNFFNLERISKSNACVIAQKSDNDPDAWCIGVSNDDHAFNKLNPFNREWPVYDMNCTKETLHYSMNRLSVSNIIDSDYHHWYFGLSNGRYFYILMEWVMDSRAVQTGEGVSERATPETNAVEPHASNEDSYFK